MVEINPYQAQPGVELDELIHRRVMRKPDRDYPPYSLSEKASANVLARLKSDTGRTVIVGRTALRKQKWFARYESDPSDGTEVLAETQALAICRLALLHALKDEQSA